MELVNLTGHRIVFCGQDFHVLEPSGDVLRIRHLETKQGDIVSRWPKPNYLPPRKDGVLYVVSKQTAEAMALLGRDDFVYPSQMKYLVVEKPVRVGDRQAFDEDGIPLYREEHIVVCAQQLAKIKRSN